MQKYAFYSAFSPILPQNLCKRLHLGHNLSAIGIFGLAERGGKALPQMEKSGRCFPGKWLMFFREAAGLFPKSGRGKEEAPRGCCPGGLVGGILAGLRCRLLDVCLLFLHFQEFPLDMAPACVSGE